MDVNEAARLMGQKGGSVKSEAKAKAARENGKRGGRPSSSPHPTIASMSEAFRWVKRHNMSKIFHLPGRGDYHFYPDGTKEKL